MERAGVKLGQALGRASLARGSAQIEEASAADRALCRRIAHDEAVAGDCRNRTVEHKLNARLAPGRNRGVAVQDDTRADFRRRVM